MSQAFPTRGTAWRAWREFANRDRLLVLDGATGSELTEVPGIDWASQWSGWPAQLSLPDAVKKVHRRYIDAGADVITANTYCANRHVMGDLCSSSESPGVDMVRRANIRAVELAREAASEAGRSVVVAGSMSNHPPHYAANATAQQGCNPTLEGSWPSSADQEMANYREQAGLLLEAGVDIILLEMVKDSVHGTMLATAASEVGLPVIVGLTLKTLDTWDMAFVARDDDKLSLEQMVQSWRMLPNVVGFAIMHSSALEAEHMVAALSKCWPGFIACYPNRQRETHSLVLPDAVACYDEICPQEFAAMAQRWRRAGAHMVGGCCGVGPDHIRAVAAAANPGLATADKPRTIRSEE